MPYSCARHNQQLGLKYSDVLLRSMYYSSLYMRLILANKEKGARTKTVGQALHKRRPHNPKDGTILRKFIYGRLYNGKHAQRYGHAPTDGCPLCNKLGSCTHIAGECPEHEALRANRHNAACQLVHAAIRVAAKGIGALHTAHDLVLVAADTGSQPQTLEETIASLSSTPFGDDADARPVTTTFDWLEPLPTKEDIRRRRHKDVSLDPRYILGVLSAAVGYLECTVGFSPHIY